MYTLLVIDMQPGFLSFWDNTSSKHVRSNCLREVNKAIQDKATIVFVEFEGSGDTISELLTPISESNYLDFHRVYKAWDDCTFAFAKASAKFNIPTTHLRVCGVNTDCCVKHSVLGLSSFYPRSTIEVVSDACDSDFSHQSGLRAMRKIGGNVKVV
jgi:nicotinamidase-related amidase